jgi:hypothetical protein
MKACSEIEAWWREALGQTAGYWGGQVYCDINNGNLFEKGYEDAYYNNSYGRSHCHAGTFCNECGSKK